jgi:hypothetical protein
MNMNYSSELGIVQVRSSMVRARGEAVQRSIHERGWALAASVGIPRDLCCLHNASLDDGLRGWCAGNPERLRVAKLAKAILNDWSASRLADAICARMWRNFSRRHGMCLGSPPGRVELGNRYVLFRVVAGASVLN